MLKDLNLIYVNKLIWICARMEKNSVLKKDSIGVSSKNILAGCSEK